MGASFLITLREGLEIALVLVILIAYLVKSGRGSEVGAVWRGAGAAVGACAVAGAIVFAAVGGLNGKVEQAVEGSIAVAAAAVLTWMIFWMRANSRSLGAELRHKVDATAAAKTGATALATIAFVAVVREGLETVLFLLSAESGSASGAQVVIGGLLGIVVAAALGLVIYRSGERLNLRRFFEVTGILLILFAAGLVGKAFHEFRELLGFESGGLIDPAWTITSGVWAEGTFYDFMKGFFGWHAETEKIRLIAYFAYLVPVLWLFLKGPKPAATTPAPTPQKEPVSV